MSGASAGALSPFGLAMAQVLQIWGELEGPHARYPEGTVSPKVRR